MVVTVMLAAALTALGAIAPAAQTARCERTPHGVRAVRNGRTFWEFSSDGGKPCVHPLAVPDGTVITDFNNPDHPRHRWLWFSWKFLNGVNYWEIDANGRSRGEQRVVSEDVDITTVHAAETVELDSRERKKAE